MNAKALPREEGAALVIALGLGDGGTVFARPGSFAPAMKCRRR
jgi:hypothetical protein